MVKELAFGDVERELAATSRVLAALPGEHFAWRPHAKSMTLGELAQHVANLVGWATDTLAKEVLDLATVPPSPRAAGLADVLASFDAHAAAFAEAWARTDDARLAMPWTLRHGDQVLHTATRAKVLRTWCVSHLVHHRAQLCVMLRLHDRPVPAVYFNSADEPGWTFD